MLISREAEISSNLKVREIHSRRTQNDLFYFFPKFMQLKKKSD